MPPMFTARANVSSVLKNSQKGELYSFKQQKRGNKSYNLTNIRYKLQLVVRETVGRQEHLIY